MHMHDIRFVDSKETMFLGDFLQKKLFSAVSSKTFAQNVNDIHIK